MHKLFGRAPHIAMISCFRMSVAVALVCSMHSEAVAGRKAARLAAAEAENVVTTSAGSSSSTSIPFCVDFSYCDYDIVIADGGEFESLVLEIRGSSALNPTWCYLDEALAGAVLTHQTYYETSVTGISTSLLPGARIVRCEGEDLFDTDYQGYSFDFTDLSVYVVEAFDRNGESVTPPQLCAANLRCEEDHCGFSDFESEPECGDAIYDGRVTAGDSLAALRTSVGMPSCEPFPTSCDTNGDGEVTASDALQILKLAVGQTVTTLSCPLPCNS